MKNFLLYVALFETITTLSLKFLSVVALIKFIFFM